MNYNVSMPQRAVYPLEFYDDVPFIVGQLKGEEKRFILDSGAQDLVLNTRYLPKKDLPEGDGVFGATGVVKTFYTRLGELHFGDWKFGDREVIANDMEHLEKEYGVEIHGIVGFRQLIHFDWMVDYDKAELHLWDRFPKNEHEILGKTRIVFHDHLPMLDVQVGEHTCKMLLDTGAAMFAYAESQKHKVEANVDLEGTKQMASAAPDEATVIKGTLKSFKIKELDFGPSEINYMDLEHLRKRLGDFDGIVGYPILSQYRTVVSWNNHGMLFMEK